MTFGRCYTDMLSDIRVARILGYNRSRYQPHCRDRHRFDAIAEEVRASCNASFRHADVKQHGAQDGSIAVAQRVAPDHERNLHVVE